MIGLAIIGLPIDYYYDNDSDQRRIFLTPTDHFSLAGCAQAMFLVSQGGPLSVHLPTLNRDEEPSWGLIYI